MIRDALAALRARGGRTLLAAVGVLAASLVVGTATTVGFSLATGFDRAAEHADLPDIIARFTRDDPAEVDARVARCPTSRRAPIAASSSTGGSVRQHRTGKGAITAVLGGRRGYLIIDGRDLRDGTTGEVVVERGLAREWDVSVGDAFAADGAGTLRVVGIAVSPDNVAYPLASAARVYVTERQFRDFRGSGRSDVRPDTALLWLNDPSKADVTLTQARAVAFGLGKLQFITRTGVQILLSQAAGIVISLLVAFSLVALVAAGTMLAAGAHAEVQRRLTGFGVQRALGFGPAGSRRSRRSRPRPSRSPQPPWASPSAPWSWPGPAADLLAALNEIGPGFALIPPLPSPCSRSWRSSSPPRPGRPGEPPAARQSRSSAAATSPARPRSRPMSDP